MTVQPGDVSSAHSGLRAKSKQVEHWDSRQANQRKRWSGQSYQGEAERSYLERAIQHLYPMKLSCDQLRGEHEEGERMSHLNPSAIEFRPLRRAAIAAADKICLIAQVEANDTEH